MSTIELILIGALLFSIGAIIYLYLRIQRISSNYNKLVRGSKGENFEELLKNLFSKLSNNGTKIEEVKKELNKFKESTKCYVQKVGFKRFNPFHETGGDQSFIAVLLDRNNNGVILSSLHQRESTRVYGKQLENGESKQKLSKEEEELLKETISK
jgi:hypothetical protein